MLAIKTRRDSEYVPRVGPQGRDDAVPHDMIISHRSTPLALGLNPAALASPARLLQIELADRLGAVDSGSGAWSGRTRTTIILALATSLWLPLILAVKLY